MTEELLGERESLGVFTYAMVGMAIVDVDSRFRCVNGAMCGALGSPERQLVGLSVLEVTDPHDRGVVADDIRRLVAGDTEVVQRDRRYLSTTGEPVCVHTSMAAVRGGSGAVEHLVMLSEDITEQRHAEHLLEASFARFEAMFDNSPVPMGLIDMGGVIRSANAAFSTLVGVESEDLAGRRLGQLIGELAESDFQVAARGHTTMVGERPLVRPDGTPGWVFVAVTCLEPVGEGDGGGGEVIVHLIDFTERRAGRDLLHHRGLHDELTGLANRHLFTQRLRESLEDRRRGDFTLTVFMVNLDHFNQVNNGLGHQSGDLVLVEAARRIHTITRITDFSARFGDDEFAVVAYDVCDDGDAFAVASQLRRRLSDPYHVAGNVIHVGLSVGFALSPADGRDADMLIQKAGIALYRAKRLSGGIAAFGAEDDGASFHNLSLVEDLRQAVASDSIDLAYQPIVGADRTVKGVEALARWQHRTQGAIPPDQFIPLAEQDHLMGELTRLVLRRAMRQHLSWLAEGLDIPSISVNVSASSLRTGVLWGLVDDALNESGLPGERLVLEITESALTDGSDPAVVANIGRLRALGVRLSIDDFGTGYSSMAYLKRLNFDELKIDRSFIIDIDSDERSVPIVRSVIQLAHSLGLRTVAEGVETGDAERILGELGCDLLQGYGICRPGQPSAVAGYVATVRQRRLSLHQRSR